MKRKIICLIALCIALTTAPSVAQTFREQTENWLQATPPTVDDDEEMKALPTAPTAPVGDAVGFLAGLSLAYVLYLQKRKRIGKSIY
jgi:hypothetical protein